MKKTMDELNALDKEKYLTAEKCLLQSLKFYKKNLLVKLLLFIPFAIIISAIFLGVFLSQMWYIALILIVAIIVICHICYIMLVINPSIRESAKFLAQYKSQMAAFYKSTKLNWFNRFIFKQFFLVDMYGVHEAISIMKFPEKYERVQANLEDKTGLNMTNEEQNKEPGIFETIMRASSQDNE
ncbi:hypothetical protein ACM0IS_02005 [Mycoplasma aquilae ATCC BAA-1896]|uniref:hypothetical protein n=1 Tax=Mycoplasma aquilae TaxID=1312741 RepID=UPI003A8919F9